MTRLAGALLGVSLLVTGCTVAEPDPGAVPYRGRCAGVEYAAVRGRAPDAGAALLLDHPVAAAVCAAYWIPQVDDRFVPQGLEVRGRTAYVGGYRWAPDYATRPCQIAVVDLRSGRVRTLVDRFEAPVYGPRPTYCRHGGGLASTADGLWVAETERLWLLDTDRLGHGDPVLRVWRLDRGVRGSTLAIGHGRLGLGSYRSQRPGRITWYRLGDVLAPGVDHLVAPGRSERWLPSPSRPWPIASVDPRTPRSRRHTRSTGSPCPSRSGSSSHNRSVSATQSPSRVDSRPPPWRQYVGRGP